MDRELQWEDTIQKDSTGFTLLPAGDYDFTVAKFERGRHTGSTKLPACNKAILTLTIHCPQNGDVSYEHNLFLHTKTEGLLSNFFAGIGQKRKGEPLRMNWNAVMGAKGKLKLKINTYQKKDGSGEGQSNEISTFYSHEELAEKGMAAPGGQPPYQQPAPQQQYQAPPQQQYQVPPQQQPPYQPPFPTNAPPQGGNYTNGKF